MPSSMTLSPEYAALTGKLLNLADYFEPNDTSAATQIRDSVAAIRAQAARIEALEGALRDAKLSLDVAIYGLPEMLENNALSDEEGMVGQLQAAVDRMAAILQEQNNAGDQGNG